MERGVSYETPDLIHMETISLVILLYTWQPQQLDLLELAYKIATSHAMMHALVPWTATDQQLSVEIQIAIMGYSLISSVAFT